MFIFRLRSLSCLRTELAAFWSFVVIGNNGFDITHAAIAQFKRVPVENFM